MSMDRPIKVAVVIPQYGLLGGAEGFVFALTERLARDTAFDIHVLANRWRSKSPAISYHRVPILKFPRWAKPISFARSVRKVLGRHRFDVVHSHERIFQMDLLTFHGIPHQTWVMRARRKRLSLFDRATAWVEREGMTWGGLKHILPVSQLVKDELLAVYPSLAPEVSVCHPGVELDRFAAALRPGSREKIRSRHGLSPDDVVVLFVGMNFEIKRLGLLIRGINGLAADAKSRTRLLVVGKGNQGRYRQQARDLGMGDRVVFAGTTRDVAPYYLASDIFAMPSRFDTFGMVVLEAMAAGLPVIVSARVGARDLVTSGEQGYVLSDDPSDAEMTASLDGLMRPENRMKMGEQARYTARAHTWDRTVDQVASRYHGIAGGRRDIPSFRNAAGRDPSTHEM